MPRCTPRLRRARAAPRSPFGRRLHQVASTTDGTSRGAKDAGRAPVRWALDRFVHRQIFANRALKGASRRANLIDGDGPFCSQQAVGRAIETQHVDGPRAVAPELQIRHVAGLKVPFMPMSTSSQRLSAADSHHTVVVGDVEPIHGCGLTNWNSARCGDVTGCGCRRRLRWNGRCRRAVAAATASATTNRRGAGHGQAIATIPWRRVLRRAPPRGCCAGRSCPRGRRIRRAAARRRA